MSPKIFTKAILFLTLALIFSCERDYNNPWDGKANLASESWAPQNLTIEDVSITEKNLTWTYAGDNHFEGFKLDRKAGNAAWQEAYQVLPKETRNWTDTEIIPDPSLTYSYRVYAFAGKYASSEVAISAIAEFAPPTYLHAEKLTDKSYKLTWQDNSTGEHGFKIDRKIDEGNWAVAFGNLPENQTSFTDTNVFRAINVEYRVYAFFESHETSKVNAAATAELTAPSDLQVEKLNDKSYRLSWTDNSTGEQGFKIDRKIDQGDWVEVFGKVAENQTSFTDTNVFRAVNVEYQVYAFYESQESSKVVTGTTAGLTAPSNLQIIPTTITSLNLTWQDNSNGEDGFKVEKRYEGGVWGQVASITVNSFQDSNFELDTLVYYRVCAFVGQHNSSFAEKSFNTAIPTPTNLSITANSIISVTLNWQYNIAGAEGFVVERENEEGIWETLKSLAANIKTYEDHTFALNTIIKYRVKAFVGQYSSSYIEKSYNSSIPAPSNLQITPNSITSVTLSWQDNSNGEAGFIIDRKVNSGVWELNYGSVGQNQISFNDNNVNGQTNDYTYRVYAFFGQYNSATVESTISWPEVSTLTVTYITYNSATSGGNITIQGNYTIIARGVCYGTNQNPDMSGPHTSDGSGAGTFSSNISGLNFGTNYNVRAYATTNFGILYGMNKNFITNSPGIGDTYDGGIVFYLDGNGGGLVCAPTDQSTGAEWGCYGTAIGETSTAVGTGAENTAKIVAGCSTAGIAARICTDLVVNGYNDWFLPSKDELNLMYQNLKVAGIGGFASDAYWTSSEYSANPAWTQYFFNGNQYGYTKDFALYVRAVRAF
jgi:hypothetical protein